MATRAPGRCCPDHSQDIVCYSLNPFQASVLCGWGVSPVAISFPRLCCAACPHSLNPVHHCDVRLRLSTTRIGTHKQHAASQKLTPKQDSYDTIQLNAHELQTTKLIDHELLGKSTAIPPRCPSRIGCRHLRYALFLRAYWTIHVLWRGFTLARIYLILIHLHLGERLTTNRFIIS